jgi:hypothetical protein
MSVSVYGVCGRLADSRLNNSSLIAFCTTVSGRWLLRSAFASYSSIESAPAMAIATALAIRIRILSAQRE